MNSIRTPMIPSRQNPNDQYIQKGIESLKELFKTPSLQEIYMGQKAQQLKADMDYKKQLFDRAINFSDDPLEQVRLDYANQVANQQSLADSFYAKLVQEAAKSVPQNQVKLIPNNISSLFDGRKEISGTVVLSPNQVAYVGGQGDPLMSAITANMGQKVQLPSGDVVLGQQKPMPEPKPLTPDQSIVQALQRGDTGMARQIYELTNPPPREKTLSGKSKPAEEPVLNWSETAQTAQPATAETVPASPPQMATEQSQPTVPNRSGGIWFASEGKENNVKALPKENQEDLLNITNTLDAINELTDKINKNYDIFSPLKAKVGEAIGVPSTSTEISHAFNKIVALGLPNLIQKFKLAPFSNADLEILKAVAGGDKVLSKDEALNILTKLKTGFKNSAEIDGYLQYIHPTLFSGKHTGFDGTYLDENNNLIRFNKNSGEIRRAKGQ
jgi:hypothetical protein